MYQVEVNPTDFLILVVDDSKPNVILLSHILTEHGFKVEKSYDGEEALDKIKKINPDLILMDIMMPTTSGIEVSEVLKKSNFNSIPIIFLSGSKDIGDKVKAFEAGAADFISKPFDKEELIMRMKNHLMLKVLREEGEERLKELEKRESELSEANQKKHKLMRMLSHDIKNPISGIMGLSSILLEDDSIEDEEKNEMLEIIYSRSESLIDLVKDALDKEIFIDKFGTTLLEKKDIVQIIKEAVKKNTPKAALKKIVISLKTTSKEILISIDEIKIKYVFNTLLANLIKFNSNKGSIEIKIEEAAKNNEELLSIKIISSSLGIPNVKLSNFLISLDEDRKDNISNRLGTNFDLEEVRTYVEAHNGKIWADTNDAVGTIFYIELPKEN